MSQQHSQTTTIDGTAYEVHYLSPDEAVDLGVDLAKMAGGAIAAAAAGLEAEEDTPEAKARAEAALMKVIEALVMSADKATYRRIIETMMKVTFAAGQPMVANGQPLWKAHFAGKLGRLAKVVGFAVRVNYSDFFSAGAPILTLAISRFGVGAPKVSES